MQRRDKRSQRKAVKRKRAILMMVNTNPPL